MGDLHALRATLRQFDRIVVAFSGGADSSFLAWVATDTLGSDRVTCVTALSPSLASFEHEECARIAAEWALNWLEVETAVLASVEAAESGLRALGFRDVRVRHYRDLARVEVPVADLAALLCVRD